MLRPNYRIFPMYVTKLVYYAYVYLFMTYCLAVWGNVVKVHINRIVTRQKQAIRLGYGIYYRLDHAAPKAYKK